VTQLRFIRATHLFVGMVVTAPVGCGSHDAASVAPARVRLWHTFGPAETEALNQALAERDLAVGA
jgi:hypothetical protein